MRDSEFYSLFALTAAAFVAGAFVIYRHESNWKRLRSGTEDVFSWSAR